MATRKKRTTKVTQRRDGSLDITFGSSKKDQAASRAFMAALAGQTPEEAFPDHDSGSVSPQGAISIPQE